MIVIWTGVAGAAAVLAVALWPARRPSGSRGLGGRHAHRHSSATRDDRAAEPFTGWSDPGGFAADATCPVPQVDHDEYRPQMGYPPDPPVAGRPVPRRTYGRARCEPGMLLPPVGLAAAVAIVLTEMITQAAEQAVRERENAGDEIILLRAEAHRLREAAGQRQRDEQDFAYLFTPGVRYGDWEPWPTDSGIMAAITAGETEAAVAS